MVSLPNQWVQVCWRVVPLECARAVRHCPRCLGNKPFVCSEKFRVNAHKRRVDVWLVYRCLDCDGSWKATIHERCLPRDIGPERYRRYEENDGELAWQYAFDAPWLRRAGAELDGPVPFRIDKVGAGVAQAVRFEFAHPFKVRLDRLLAHGLSISRSQVAKSFRRSRISVEGGGSLSKPARQGAIVRVVGDFESRPT